MNIPRILPLVAVAIGGVLAVKLLTGADDIPAALSSAQAFAEGVVSQAKPDGSTPAAVPAKPATVCAPTAAELAKEAGLSPAELQVLQSLGVRRGQLDQREAGMDTQLQLLAAAEAKLDAKLAALEALKVDMNGLLGQVDAKQQAEVDRLVKVYEGMKPKDAAARFAILTDAVRLPIATRMKERALSAMLAQMSPDEAKKVTEALAQRYAAAAAQVAAGRAAVASPTATAAATPPPAPPVAAPAPTQTAQNAQPTPEKPATPPKPRAPRPRRTAQAAAKPATAPPKAPGTATAAGSPAAKPATTALATPPKAAPPKAGATTTAAPAAAPPSAKPAAAAPPKPATATPAPAATSPPAPAKPA